MFIRALFKQEARRALSGHFPEAMLITILASLMPAIILLAPSNMALEILSLFIMGPLLLAVSRYFWRVSTGAKPTVGSFFAAFNECSTACLAYLWQTLWTCLWLLLLIVPGIVKYLSYSQQFFLLAEYPQLGARRSLELSKRLTEGYKWELFVTYLSFLGWAVLSFFTLGLALVYVLPYYYTTMAQIYHYLKEDALASGRLSAADLPQADSEPKVSAAPQQPEENAAEALVWTAIEEEELTHEQE